MEKEVLYELGNKGAKIAIEEPSQLDRIENKVDRILESLGNKELPTHFELGSITNEWQLTTNRGR